MIRRRFCEEMDKTELMEGIEKERISKDVRGGD
jgi:hypothetical protein